MALNFVDMLKSWQDVGLYEVILPFMLIFTVSFAILQKVKVLGDKKEFNVIVALVIGLLFVRNQYLVGLINRFLPNVSLFMIVILMFLLVFGIFAGEYKGWTGIMLSIAFIVSLAFILIALSSDFIGQDTFLPDWIVNMDDQTKSMIFLVGTMIIIIWLVTRDTSPGGKLKQWVTERTQEVGGRHGGQQP